MPNYSRDHKGHTILATPRSSANSPTPQRQAESPSRKFNHSHCVFVKDGEAIADPNSSDGQVESLNLLTGLQPGGVPRKWRLSMRHVIRTTVTVAILSVAGKYGWAQAAAGTPTQQQNEPSSPKPAVDCNAQQTSGSDPASKTKRTLSWAQRQAAKLAALRAGQNAGSAGGAEGANAQPAPSQPCPAADPNAPAETQSGATPAGNGASGMGGRSLFSGTANNNQFGRGQSGRGTGSGNSYIEWNHDGRAANSEIPVVFIKEPNKGPAQAGYLGYEKSAPTVHYLRSTAEQKTYRVEFGGTQFTVYLDDEMRVAKLKLIGGSQTQDDNAGGAAGVEASSPIEISNGTGTRAVLTYTDRDGNSQTVEVHRRKASANPDGQWLNHDNSIEYSVAGASVTASPVKQP